MGLFAPLFLLSQALIVWVCLGRSGGVDRGLAFPAACFYTAYFMTLRRRGWCIVAHHSPTCKCGAVYILAVSERYVSVVKTRALCPIDLPIGLYPTSSRTEVECDLRLVAFLPASHSRLSAPSPHSTQACSPPPFLVILASFQFNTTNADLLRLRVYRPRQLNTDSRLPARLFVTYLPPQVRVAHQQELRALLRRRPQHRLHGRVWH